ncbi:MAG: hypothetical protein AB1345_05655 [Chloroflexota bacterium]
MKITIFDRLILLITSLLAAYQVAVGIEGVDTLPMIAYTIAFGVLLVAVLLLIILGLEVLDSPIVVIISTVIPLSLSLGLVWEHLPTWHTFYLTFAILGFLAIVITRLVQTGKAATIVLAIVHGIAGLIIAVLPIALSVMEITKPGFSLVGIGGALIGLGGLLLSFLKTGRPVLSGEMMMKVLPGLLFLMTAAFVAGFALK